LTRPTPSHFYQLVAVFSPYFPAPGTLLNGFAFAPTGGVWEATCSPVAWRRIAIATGAMGMGVGSAGLLVISAASGDAQLAAHLVFGCGIGLRVSAMTSGC
jgi:hypothetical protein